MRTHPHDDYRPISRESAMGRLLLLTILVTARVLSMRLRLERWQVANAERYFDDIWGDEPRMKTRLSHRQGPSTFFMLNALLSTVLFLAIFVGGGELEHSWIQALAALVAIPAGLLLGLAATFYGRSALVQADYRHWVSAGCPEDWRPAAKSQPAAIDLIAGIMIGSLIAGLFLKMMFQ